MPGGCDQATAIEPCSETAAHGSVSPAQPLGSALLSKGTPGLPRVLVKKRDHLEATLRCCTLVALGYFSPTPVGALPQGPHPRAVTCSHWAEVSPPAAKGGSWHLITAKTKWLEEKKMHLQDEQSTLWDRSSSSALLLGKCCPALCASCLSVCPGVWAGSLSLRWG